MIYDHYINILEEQCEKEYADARLACIWPPRSRVKFMGKKSRLFLEGITTIEQTLYDDQIEFVKREFASGKKKIVIPFANEGQKIGMQASRSELKHVGVRVSKRNIILSLPSD
jgi:hypothetical protein